MNEREREAEVEREREVETRIEEDERGGNDRRGDRERSRDRDRGRDSRSDCRGSSRDRLVCEAAVHLVALLCRISFYHFSLSVGHSIFLF